MKRKVIFLILRQLRLLFRRLRRISKKKVLFDCPYLFHFFHIEPIIYELIKDVDIEITLVKWGNFTNPNLPGINFVDRDSLFTNPFQTYDFFATTDYHSLPWWFDTIPRAFIFHGVGPKVSYFTSDNMKYFDTIFCPGPYAESKLRAKFPQSPSIIPVGLPVTDKLANGVRPPLSPKFSSPIEKPVLLYAPSWSIDPAFVSMDEDLLKNLAAQDLVNVIIRPHPLLLEPDKCGGKDWKRFFSYLEKEFDHIRLFIDPDSSIYEVLGSADILLSDISSVTFEYLACNRPIILYLKSGIGDYYGAEDIIRETENACISLDSSDGLYGALLEGLNSKRFKQAYLPRQKQLEEKFFYNHGHASVVASDYIRAQL